MTVLVSPLVVCLLQAILLLASSVVQVSTSQPEKISLIVTQSGSHAIKFQTSELIKFFKCLCSTRTHKCEVFVDDDNFVSDIRAMRSSYRTTHSQFVKFECKTFPNRNDFRCLRRNLSPFQCQPLETCWKFHSYQSTCNHLGPIGIFWNQNMSFSQDNMNLSVRDCVSGCHSHVTTTTPTTASVTSRAVVSDTGTPVSPVLKPVLGWDNKTAMDNNTTMPEIMESKEKKSDPSSESDTNMVVYIIVGVLVFLTLSVTIVLGLIRFRRKQRQNHCTYQDPKLSLSVNMKFRTRCQQRLEEKKRESASLDFNLNSAKTDLGEAHLHETIGDDGNTMGSFLNGKNVNNFLNVSESDTVQSDIGQSSTGQSNTDKSYTCQSDSGKFDTEQSRNDVELKTFCVSSALRNNGYSDLNWNNDHNGSTNQLMASKTKYGQNNCQSPAAATQALKDVSQDDNIKKAAMYATVSKVKSENKKIFSEKIRKVTSSKKELLYPRETVQKEPASCQTELFNQKTRSSRFQCAEKDEAKLLQDKNKILNATPLTYQPITAPPHTTSDQRTNEINSSMAEERIYFELEKEEDIESDSSSCYSDINVGVDFNIAQAFFDTDYHDENPYENEPYCEKVVDPIYSQRA